MKAEQKSLVDQFISVDNLINQNQMSQAMKELKDIEKKATEKWSFLGLYKRYDRLGETEKAEKILKKGLKKDSNSKELLAVYADFLIDQERYEEALKYSKKLEKTEYASIYSEAILRSSLDADSPKDTQEYYNIYYNAYLSSKNPVWIRNCAVLDLKLGRYDRIASLLPTSFANVDDAYFWALALYDAGQYKDAIQILEKSIGLMKDYHDPSRFKTTQIEQIALLSDAYMSISDMNNAEKIRQDLIVNIDNLAASPEDKILPVIITNSAIWSYNQEQYDKCADLLFYVVNKWPDYVPGLILYSDFAYNSNLEREENLEMTALREAGLATVEMEKYDSRRKVPVSDAKYRVEKALSKTDDPYLRIVQLDLMYKTDKTLTNKEKNSDLWRVLEDSYASSNEFQSLLIQYALHSLLLTREYEDAWDLFQTYVLSISDFDAKKDFWPQFIQNIRNYDYGIVEFGAWFAAYYKLKFAALPLYEYCVYGDNLKSEEKSRNDYVLQNASSASCMNLADIYESLGNDKAALDLYGRVGGRESKNSVRSEIFYRIASIYERQGDNKNALRSVEYACELYPENVRASLLKDNLNIKNN